MSRPRAGGARSDIDLLAPFWNETVERTVLPNGLTLIVRPDDAADLASVQVWVKTGSVHEGRWLGAGISHFLEHMMFKGTARRTGRAISAEVQAHGGYINAYTTFDRTVYYIDLPAEHAGFALDVLADAVLGSTLPADEVEREKAVILREIAMTRDDPDQRLGEMLFDTAFRTHPYRFPIIGHRELFETLGREDLVEYYRDRYVPNNLVVVVVGAVDPEAVKAEAVRCFGAAPRGRLAPVLVPGEEPQLAGRSLHAREPVELTRAGMAWQVPGLTHPDAPLLDVLAMILGNGDSSLLWTRLRDRKRLVHSIDAHCWNPGGVGLFYISFTCDPDKRDRALSEVKAELARVARAGLSPALLRKAIRQLVVGEINSRKTMSGQASRLGAAEVVAGDLAFSRSYFERLRTVRPAQLLRALREHLVPARLTEISTNPESAPAPAAPVARSAARAREFAEIRLPNGARIVHQRDSRLPNLHLRVACHGGPMHEPPGLSGASGLLATLLTKDTRGRSADEIAREIEGAGGSFYPFAGNNSLGFAVEVLPTDADKALRVLRDGLLEPAFLADTLEIERESQLADLKQDRDDVVTYARKRLRERFFGSYPLAFDAQGTIETVGALDAPAISALYGRLVTAPNVVIAVAGDFDPDVLLPKLARIAGGLPAGEASGRPPGCQAPQAAQWEERQPREQAVLFEAYACPGLLDDDFHTGEVADELFSGMASRLFERVREEKGLAYFIRSTRVTGLSAGMFQFYAGTAPESVEAVYAEIEAEIRRVSEGGVEDAELDRCRARLKAARRQSLQTPGARALNAALNALYGLPVNDWMSYDERISAVSRDRLAEFARLHFRVENRVRLVVRP